MVISSIEGLGKRIGVFGGSFDPVHHGHLELAKLARDSLELEAIVFIPTNQNPLRNNPPSVSVADRLKMLSSALKTIEGFYVSDIECKNNSKVSYTVETLKAIKETANSELELFFLCGSDQIAGFHSWKDYKDLFNLSKFVVFGRSGLHASDFSKINVNLDAEDIRHLSSHFIQFDFQISSTEIRNWIRLGELERCRPFLDADVFEYIKQQKLYQ